MHYTFWVITQIKATTCCSKHNVWYMQVHFSPSLKRQPDGEKVE